MYQGAWERITSTKITYGKDKKGFYDKFFYHEWDNQRVYNSF
jgi:hypothetical protein